MSLISVLLMVGASFALIFCLAPLLIGIVYLINYIESLVYRFMSRYRK